MGTDLTFSPTIGLRCRGLWWNGCRASWGKKRNRKLVASSCPRAENSILVMAPAMFTSACARRSRCQESFTIVGMGHAPKIEQIIHTLMYQVAAGKAHLVVAKGLSNSDPVVLNAARVFFAMSIDAHIYYSQMYAARLHDQTRGAVTVSMLLRRAGKEASSAKYGNGAEVRAAIASSEKVLSGLAGRLKSLTTVRNKWLAHTDPRTITDPVRASVVARPFFPDLEEIFQGTGTIVNEFSRLYRDITGILEILDQTDYETVMEFVSAAKCEQVRRYEAEFGVPAPFPRPKGCQ